MAEQTPNSISAPGNPIMSGTHQPLKWSVKDSDDLYNRRQAKEDWDSIKKVLDPSNFRPLTVLMSK